MLRHLTIRDFVIVASMDLEFEPGFTVLTGETGAGKSILIDALSLALGERAEAGCVRAGAERSEVSAAFDIGAEAAAWLRANEIDSDGECLLRRVVDTSGRSRAFVNGTPVSVQQLRELGELCVEIHGQHAHHSLLKTDTQRALLDGYAGAEELADQVKALYREWHSAGQARADAERNAAALAAERDQLQEQVRELEALALTPERWEELQQEHRRFANIASLGEGARAVSDLLAEGQEACLTQLGVIGTQLRRLAELDPALKGITELVQAGDIALREAAQGLRRYLDRLDADPQRLQELESLMEQVHRAARKHRVSPAGISELLGQSKTRLAQLGGSASGEALARAERETLARYQEHAARLTSARKKAAKSLGKEITAAMQGLAMPGGSFAVELSAQTEPAAYGYEQVEFRVSAHPGQALGALGKVASGGELSRVALAIQACLSKVSRVPTLIFDEVDAGIGGRVAEIVGQMLKELGTRHQVMCVTHLPQVAACADQQLSVAKSEVNGAALSRIERVAGEKRVDELARMLGGVKITETTRKHAAEMLKQQRTKA